MTTCQLCGLLVEGRELHLYCDQAEEWEALQVLPVDRECFPAIPGGDATIVLGVMRPANALDRRLARGLCLCGGGATPGLLDCARCRRREWRLARFRRYNAQRMAV